MHLLYSSPGNASDSDSANSAHGAVFSLKAMLARMRRSADRTSSAGGTSHGSAASAAISGHGVKFVGPHGAHAALAHVILCSSYVQARWQHAAACIRAVHRAACIHAHLLIFVS